MAFRQDNRWKARPRTAAVLRGLVHVGPFAVVATAGDIVDETVGDAGLGAVVDDVEDADEEAADPLPVLPLGQELAEPAEGEDDVTGASLTDHLVGGV